MKNAWRVFHADQHLFAARRHDHELVLREPANVARCQLEGAQALLRAELGPNDHDVTVALNSGDRLAIGDRLAAE